jgi:hypothetical protein
VTGITIRSGLLVSRQATKLLSPARACPRHFLGNNHNRKLALYDPKITDIRVNNFKAGKTLTEVRGDYEDLELLLDRERSATCPQGPSTKRVKRLLDIYSKLDLKRAFDTAEYLLPTTTGRGMHDVN